MIPSKSANVQQKGAENLEKNNFASHLWVFWWKHPKMSVLGRGNSKNCPIFCTWHPRILDMWFFREKKTWCLLVCSSCLRLSFYPSYFQDTVRKLSRLRGFRCVWDFSFFEPFCIEERWGTLERVQSWQRWEAPVFSGRPSVLIMIRMKWRKAFAAHFN